MSAGIVYPRGKEFPDIINQVLKNGILPNELKMAEKADPFDKINRPVSLLLHMPKVFERIIFNQIN